MKIASAKIQKTGSRRNARHVLAMLSGAVVLIAAASAGSVRAQQSEVVVDRVVAVVNTDIVTLYELNRAFKPFEANIKALRYPSEKERQTLFQVRRDLLNQLIDSQLADQQVKRYQISVSQKEIDATIERVKEARSFTEEQLREGLAAQGLTMEEYRKEIESQILRTKLVNREVKSKIVITQEDIKDYYDRHKEKFAGDKKFYLWNIFVKASEFEKEAALKEIKAVETRLEQGASFEALVKELNASASPVKGTDLGLYRRDELSPELQTVVENMKANEFSPVLDTNFGYQIIYVQQIQETPVQPLQEMEADIKQTLYNEYVDTRYQEWLEELRARSYIRIIQ
jgi:peptidyl-prolyl cis-trans isomerase SurA